MHDYGLLLKTTREAQGLTQEQAAELAGVSVDSWYAYESNKRLPTAATVNRICDALDSRWLALYFSEALAGAASVLPELQARELPTAVLTLVNRVMAFADRMRPRELMEIAEDGRIDDIERPVYEQIVEDLDGIIEAALAVKFPMDAKKDRSDVGASKRPCSRPKSKNDRKSIVSHRSEDVNSFALKGGALL